MRPKEIQEALAFNEQTFTENGWTLTAKKYLSPEQKATFEKEIKTALQKGEGNVAQHLTQCAEPDYQVKIEVNPRQILEDGLRQDRQMEALSIAEVDETNKRLRFRANKPLFEAEKEKLTNELKSMADRLGFTGFLVVLDTPPPSQTSTSPSNQPASPPPVTQKSDSVVSKQPPETSPIATNDEAPSGSQVWEQNLAGPFTLAPSVECYAVGHRCLLGRLFCCFCKHHAVMPSADCFAEPVYVDRSYPITPAFASAKNVPNGFWNNEP
ncbi:MAG: hypothetical protein H5U08_18685, partial [Thermogutta sp.]|uniref:hypothetical protein n=1 Tax=Thermogutta sp. TaxID=1962930 RepID=UPI0019B52CD1